MFELASYQRYAPGGQRFGKGAGTIGGTMAGERYSKPQPLGQIWSVLFGYS